MEKTYGELCRHAKYKFTGHENRTIGMLMESFKDLDPGISTDFYGTGSIINDFESEIASLLGKEKAVFFPSGTMAQQIALRIWSDRAKIKKVAYHPLCHLEIHENDGLKILHHMEPILIGSKDGLFTLDDVKSINEPVACLLVELPQREIGGQLPSLEELAKLSEYCRNRGIKLHLDGARLFEVLPYYNKPANEICSLFDSVYVSFYKGLGGIAGAVLAGNEDFIEQSKVWKRRYGGDLISLYPYIINARFCLNKRMDKMETYWEYAQAAAEGFNRIDGIETIPKVPVCNMFHIYFDVSKKDAEDIFSKIIEKHNLSMVPYIQELSPSKCKSELSFGDNYKSIPQELIIEAFKELEFLIENL